MDAQERAQQERQETAEEKRRHYLSDAERREWSGLSEWHDPLEKEKPEPRRNDGKFAFVSLLCGIAALLTSCTGTVNALFGAAAVISGILAKKRQESAHAPATAGIILGVCGIGISLALLAFWALKNIFGPSAAPMFTSLMI